MVGHELIQKRQKEIVFATKINKTLPLRTAPTPLEVGRRHRANHLYIARSGLDCLPGEPLAERAPYPRRVHQG